MKPIQKGMTTAVTRNELEAAALNPASMTLKRSWQ
jgi:hypothetical protein